MNKSVIILVILLIAGCTQTASSSENTTLESVQSGPASYNISIQNFAFSPQTITLRIGDTVTWTNLDSAAHIVASTVPNLPGFLSPSLANRATYSFTFIISGTYTYKCQIHPSMTGTIIVE